MKVELLQGNKTTNITKFSGDITISSSLDSLGSETSLKLARNYLDSNFVLIESIEPGNFIRIIGENEILLFGIIVEIEKTQFSLDVSLLDFLFYLNENELTKQFKKLNASSAIKNVLNEINVEIGDIPTIATNITKIYKDKKASEIINDILNQVLNETGDKYRLEVEEEKISVKKYRYLEIDEDLGELGQITKKESIKNLKNKILVLSNKQKETKVLGNAQDSFNIKKFGQLQEIIEVDPKEASNCRNIAEKKLNELNKISKFITTKVIGNDKLKAGRIVKIRNTEYEINGSYLISSCSHIFNNNNHICELELEIL